MSSAIKAVAMKPIPDYRISVDKYLESKDNLHVTDRDVFYQAECVEDGNGGYWIMGVPYNSGPGMGCHERHLVGVDVSEVPERASGLLLHLRVVLVPVHRADWGT